MTSSSNVVLRSGDLLLSTSQTLVNTVNTVGVMGKGIALAFKQRYPAMYDDYRRRCERNEVLLGEPYVYGVGQRKIVNFPTKAHWRSVSKLDDIVAGLEYLLAHYKDWGVSSIAVPPLGCGNGQLEWDVVGPTLVRYLSRMDIPVELYVPAGIAAESGVDALFDDARLERKRKVPAEWIAVVAVLDRLQRTPLHWPVGRVFFQKLVYFATQAGIETGLHFEAGSYGPFSGELKRRIAQLQNNGLAIESQTGKMFEVLVGPTYRDAVESVRHELEPFREQVMRTVDLMHRMNLRSAEVAATVHFVAAEAERSGGQPPTFSAVASKVEEWKPGRFSDYEIADATLLLCTQRWSRIVVDERASRLVEARAGD
ncbi:type II toxin-antitoxin system antitoxin DNA ADP-ribosyl glycohydrolase DarG [Demequina phytophila]|uniref:type II toxin-antitoxin system antitoxin DNA ADP-ribosyl glycohydrolase DarG n=1 Tax=Demequina phytophila TaxID=1638981 RepID=UPI00078408DE